LENERCVAAGRDLLLFGIGQGSRRVVQKGVKGVQPPQWIGLSVEGTLVLSGTLHPTSSFCTNLKSVSINWGISSLRFGNLQFNDGYH